MQASDVPGGRSSVLKLEESGVGEVLLVDARGASPKLDRQDHTVELVRSFVGPRDATSPGCHVVDTTSEHMRRLPLKWTGCRGGRGGRDAGNDGDGGTEMMSGNDIFYFCADSAQFLLLWHEIQRLCVLAAYVGKSMQCPWHEHCILSFLWHAFAHRLQFRCHNDAHQADNFG